MIRRFCQTAFILVIAISVPLFAEDAQKEELERFQGTWAVISVTQDGKPVTSMENIRFTFKDDKIILSDRSGNTIKTADGQVEERPFKINPEAKPKRIDLTTPKKNTSLGIYELTGDKLTICHVRVRVK